MPSANPQQLAFWQQARRGEDAVDGNEVATLLQRALEENPFSASGLTLRSARQAARRLHTEATATEHGTVPPSALAYAEDELMERRAQTMEDIAAVVNGMGLEYKVPAPDTTTPVAPAAHPEAPSTSAPAEPATAPPADTPHEQQQQQPAAAAPVPLQPSPAPSATTPKSALAVLVARAKAKHQSTAVAAEGSASATVQPRLVTSNHAGSHELKRPREDAGDLSGRVRAPAARTQPSHDAKGGSGDDDDDDSFAVQLPAGVRAPTASANSASSSGGDVGTSAMKHPSQMTREEFLRQYKRAPRRGEVGQSAEEIAQAQQLGYVMSGSRSIGAQMYVDRIQRQLHEREAGKLQQQFRKVEDERMDDQMIEGLLRVLEEKTHHKKAE